MKRLVDKIMEKTDTSSSESEEKQASIPNVTWKHVWPSNETRDALSQSSLVSIPNEILLRIFKLLSVPDLCNISLVCRLFKMIADQDDIWKLKCNTSTKLYSKTFKQIYMDWMHEKYLRNIKLQIIGEWTTTACVRCSPPLYPVRPTNNHQFESIGGFTQHPNLSPDITIKLSVDIDNTAQQLLKLLEKASKFKEEWKYSPILKQMIRRYYNFMQLKSSQSQNILLIPTLDIEIIWQTHLLRPEMYKNDCIRLFRRIIDHSLLLNDIEEFFKEQAFKDTCQLYEQRFNEQYCPLPLDNIENKVQSNSYVEYFRLTSKTNRTYLYWDETYFQFLSQSPKVYENSFSFTEGDIILDMDWLNMCKQFMRESSKTVSTQNYNYYDQNEINLNSAAMKRLKKSYERFLYMAAKYPLKDGNGFVPPTYAIDIIWHSHMQEPLNYINDCNRLVGYVIYHSPWPMIEDDNMEKTRKKTDDIWKEEFQTDIKTDHLYNTIHNKVYRLR